MCFADSGVQSNSAGEKASCATPSGREWATWAGRFAIKRQCLRQNHARTHLRESAILQNARQGALNRLQQSSPAPPLPPVTRGLGLPEPTSPAHEALHSCPAMEETIQKLDDFFLQIDRSTRKRTSSACDVSARDDAYGGVTEAKQRWLSSR